MPAGFRLCPVCKQRGYRGDNATCGDPDCVDKAVESASSTATPSGGRTYGTPVKSEAARPRPGEGRDLTRRFDGALRPDDGGWDDDRSRATAAAPVVADPSAARVERDDVATGGTFRLRLDDAQVPMRTLNSRDGWTERHRAQAELRNTVDKTARQARGPTARPFRVPVRVEVTYVAATNHRRDADNIAPVLKACQDGLADADVLVDDSFVYVPEALTRVRVDTELGPFWLVEVVPIG